MSGGPTKTSMTRGALFALLSYGTAILIPLISVPLSIRYLGKAGFGLWVQMSILTVWMSHVDAGIWAGVARETAERRARGDAEGLRSLFATWLRWDLAASALLVAAGLALSRVAPVPAGAVIGLSVQAATIPVMRHFIHAVSGYQRSDLVHRVAVVVGPLSLAAMIGALKAGGGMTGLALVGAASGVLQIGLYAWILHGLGCPMSFGPFRGSDLRRLLAFGWRLEVAELLQQAFRSDRLLLGWLGASKETVAHYAVGAAPSDRIAGSVTLLSTAVLPAGADLAARGDAERLRLLFLRGTKYHAFAATLLLGFAGVFAEELLMFWMGETLPDSARVLRIMAVAGWFTAVASCAQGLTVSLGKSGRPLACALAGLGVAVLLYSAWGRRYHGPGLAVSVSAGMASGQILLMIFLRGSVEFRWRELVGSALLKPLSAGLPLVGLWASRGLLPVPAGRLQALLFLAPAFLAAALLAALLARLTRALDDYDWGVLKSAWRRAPA